MSKEPLKARPNRLPFLKKSRNKNQRKYPSQLQQQRKRLKPPQSQPLKKWRRLKQPPLKPLQPSQLPPRERKESERPYFLEYFYNLFIN